MTSEYTSDVLLSIEGRVNYADAQAQSRTLLELLTQIEQQGPRITAAFAGVSFAGVSSGTAALGTGTQAADQYAASLQSVAQASAALGAGDVASQLQSVGTGAEGAATQLNATAAAASSLGAAQSTLGETTTQSAAGLQQEAAGATQAAGALQQEKTAAEQAATANREVASSGEQASGAIGSFGSTMGSAIAQGIGFGSGAMAAATAVNFLKDKLSETIGAAEESQRVQAQTEAVLRSTGGAAGMTSQAIGDLATSLSQIAPYDDEAIQSTENLLLTFRSIGQDIFPTVTETALDMSAALGQDLKGSAIQLGKALEDPITGLTALRRVGVSFSDSQKEMIQSLVDAGDKEAAQKLILQELQTEFGGSARAAGETFGGQMTILSTKIGNFEEQVGTRAFPIILGFISRTETAAAAVEKLVGWIDKVHMPDLGALGGGGGVFDALGAAADRIGNPISLAADKLGAPEPIRRTADALGDLLNPLNAARDGWNAMGSSEDHAKASADALAVSTDALTQHLSTGTASTAVWTNMFTEGLQKIAAGMQITEPQLQAINTASRSTELALSANADAAQKLAAAYNTAASAGGPQLAAFESEFSRALDLTRGSITGQQAEIARLTALQRDGSPEAQAYASAQLAIDRAVLQLTPDLAANTVTTQQAARETKALEDAWSAAAGANNLEGELRTINSQLDEGNTKATVLKSELDRLLGQAGPEELHLTAQIKAVTASIAEMQARIADGGPTAAAIANAQREYDAALTSATTEKDRSDKLKVLNDILANADPSLRYVAGLQQQIDVLGQTKGKLDAQLQSQQANRESQLASNQVIEAGGATQDEYNQTVGRVQAAVRTEHDQTKTTVTAAVDKGKSDLADYGAATGIFTVQFQQAMRDADTAASTGGAQAGKSADDSTASGITDNAGQVTTAAAGMADQAIAAAQAKGDQWKGVGAYWASQLNAGLQSVGILVPNIGAGTPLGQLSGAGAGTSATTGAGAAGAASAHPLAYPFAGSYPITQPFGPTNETLEGPYGGYQHFHQGVDFGLPLRTPVQAVGGGKVVSANWSDSTGNTVILDIGDGMQALYGHLDRIDVKMGQLVEQGQQIGLSGNTGAFTTGPHLHLDITQNGAPVDPLAYLGTSAAGGAGRAAGAPAAAATSAGGGGSAAAQIRAWAQQNAGALGLDPSVLTELEAAINFYETGGSLNNPFQFMNDLAAQYGQGGSPGQQLSVLAQMGRVVQAYNAYVAGGRTPEAFAQAENTQEIPGMDAIQQRGYGALSDAVAAGRAAAGGGAAATATGAATGAGATPAGLQTVAPIPEKPSSAAAGTPVGQSEIQGYTDKYEQLATTLASLQAVGVPDALRPELGDFGAKMAPVQAAYENLIAAISAYNAAVSSGVKGDALKPYQDAVRGAKDQWDLLSTSAGNAMRTLTTGQSALESSTKDLTADQQKLAQVIATEHVGAYEKVVDTGRRTSDAEGQAATRTVTAYRTADDQRVVSAARAADQALQAAIAAHQRVVSDLESNVTPAQIAADRMSADSAQKSADAYATAWHTAYEERQTDINNLAASERAVNQDAQVTRQLADLGTDTSHRAATAGMLATDQAAARERRNIALASAAEQAALDRTVVADDAAIQAETDENRRAALRQKRQDDENDAEHHRQLLNTQVQDAQEADRLVAADKASLHEQQQALDQFDVSSTNATVSAIAASYRAAYASVIADEARHVQMAQFFEQQITIAATQADRDRLQSALDAENAAIDADATKTAQILQNYQKQVQAAQSAAQQTASAAGAGAGGGGVSGSPNPQAGALLVVPFTGQTMVIPDDIFGSMRLSAMQAPGFNPYASPTAVNLPGTPNYVNHPTMPNVSTTNGAMNVHVAGMAPDLKTVLTSGGGLAPPSGTPVPSLSP